MDEIAIVGGGGFIGSALARHLTKSFSVRILDIKHLPRDLRGKIEYHHCDVRKCSDLENGLKDVELVIHTAIVQIPRINESKKLGYEVNIRGTQNVCRAVNRISSVRGMILAGSWHVVGERELRGVIDEEFGFRPDKVEERARFYALCKIGQETIVRVYGEMSKKIFGVIRMGTVLGKGMPEKTAAAIFMTNGLQGKPLTPFKHSMYRPMLYTDISDICKAFEIYSKKILGSTIDEKPDFPRIVNICWPEPVTILNLAEIVRDSIVKHSNGMIRPEIEIIDQGCPTLFKPDDKDLMKVDVSRAARFLGFKKMIDPRKTIEKLTKAKSVKTEA